MSQLRIAMVTSRFWPVSGMSQILAGDLAVGLREAGHDVEVITSRWEHRWGKLFVFQGVTVHRLPVTSNGPWGNFRTQRALVRYLNQGQWDAVVVFGLDEHFETAAKTLARSATKLILRLDDSMDPSHLVSQTLNRKTVGLIKNVDAVVCTNSAIRDAMVSAGVAGEKLHLIPDGVPDNGELQRSMNQQSSSRLALSDAHPVLATDPAEPLVLTGVPLNGDVGIYDLIQAWRPVVKDYPHSRLWVIGDGHQGRHVWSQITSSNLVYSVIMPGFFDNLDDVFRAADFYVHPARNMTGHAILTRAMASGLCPVTTDSLGGLVKNDVNGKIVAPQNSQDLTTAMLQLIEDGNLKNRLGLAAAEVIASCSFRQTISRYQQLIRQSSSCEQV